MEKDSYYYYCQGMDFIDKNDFESAIANFNKSNSIKEHFKSYERLYFVYDQIGQHLEATNALKKAYDLNKQNSKTAFLYANLLFKSNELEKAKQILIDLLKRNPSYKKAEKLLEEINSELY